MTERGLACRDCAAPLVYAGRGRLPHRCDACRRALAVAQQRDWVSRNREAWLAYQRGYRAVRRARAQETSR